ncbi:PrgH/EprH family type III secretion apparatus protein [Escherichia albertii]|uniref:PrgH/EprH family type III secretion apparatus protein n=1 Tax=Escherichia albertii TaxID=208962 RepID=UPI000F5DAE96|nr:PrgH/EprH family type III secretion apparatus protein [Escherichia albertii]QSZ85626.1 PrgH/EprH family type III secretion apparatus protein [Escherichia albertii]QSZ90007.1 PrgH/EprH family type III secretion apparatus protein [Escherichia albertii]QSZ94404.1 PrgH/EprH family type III secretion apparatus protein [Escherichia albertii]QSZ98799.1 PrgH/EprH family type III secretion apparatus protein [Escherichia albertii]QTA03179.1 PrgH/EprH family type III secretion apparatus protein [Esche
MENNDNALSQEFMESYAIRLLSGPLNGCEFEITNGRLLVLVGDNASLGQSDSFPELPENIITIPYGDSTGSFEIIITTAPELIIAVRVLSEQQPDNIYLALNQQIEVLGLKFVIKQKDVIWQYTIPSAEDRRHRFSCRLLANIISPKLVIVSLVIFIIFITYLSFTYHSANDYQVSHIDKILSNKNKNYAILYGRDDIIYINTSSQDEAVWVKQALEKSQPAKPVRVIDHNDETARIYAWLADNYPDLQYFKIQLSPANNPRLTVSKQRNTITKQLIDNIITGLLNEMPYATKISIAILGDNILEAQAIDTLSSIGVTYEKYKTANNVYFNIIGSLSDSELNKINDYVDEYYKQWGKQYIRFNINLQNQDVNNSSFGYGDNRFEKSQGSKWIFQ